MAADLGEIHAELELWQQVEDDALVLLHALVLALFRQVPHIVVWYLTRYFYSETYGQY